MNWLGILLGLTLLVGITVLIVKSDKASIKQAVKTKGFELVEISTSYNFVLRNFNYKVTFLTPDGNESQANCRVSFFLGVIWENEDSFLKWLLP